ncbi:MAG: hypothetical protein ABIR06_14635 [Cyclobacteriaceae bacterium]
MKTFTLINRHFVGALLTIILASLAWSCSDDSEVSPARPKPTEPTGEETYRESGNARLSFGKDSINYNLNVFLRGDTRKKFGFVAFRQFENETQLIHLYTWVNGLEPNTSYVLQRAVDTTLDGNCTSTSWLTLGEGLTPKSIVTNKWGSGYAELFRSVAAIPVGSTFDIHFQIVKASTSQVALTSDCYEYTVH